MSQQKQQVEYKIISNTHDFVYPINKIKKAAEKKERQTQIAKQKVTATNELGTTGTVDLDGGASGQLPALLPIPSNICSS